jgi:hypothetical protein
VVKTIQTVEEEMEDPNNPYRNMPDRLWTASLGSY